MAGRPPTYNKPTNVRIDPRIAARCMRVMAALIEREPAMRSLLTSLPGVLRLLIERGLNAYEADLGLDGPVREPRKSVPPRKKR